MLKSNLLFILIALNLIIGLINVLLLVRCTNQASVNNQKIEKVLTIMQAWGLDENSD